MNPGISLHKNSAQQKAEIIIFRISWVKQPSYGASQENVSDLPPPLQHSLFIYFFL